MQKFKITLKSVTPYLQHRMDDAPLEKWEAGERPHIIERNDSNATDIDKAEYYSYYDSNARSYYLPSEHIRGSLINGGGFHKSKVGNARKSMKNIVAAMFEIEPDYLLIQPFDKINKMSAVNKNIKGRVIVTRPEWSNWEVSFTLSIGEDTVTAVSVKAIIKSAGSYVGIGSFRPTANGKYGRFELVDCVKL